MAPPSEDTIRLAGGVSSAGVGNVFAIPLDRFRVVVAQDAVMGHSLAHHFRATFSSPGIAYAGAVARTGMKVTATTLNLFIPQEMRERGPFTASFVSGLLFSPVFNVFRMLQLAKLNGENYPTAIRRIYFTRDGLRSYLGNTAIFGPGEALRTMFCFGTKDFLVPFARGRDYRPPRSEAQVAGNAAYLSAVVGPLVSVVETTAGLITETGSTVHAKLGPNATAAERMSLVGSMLRPQYVGRAWFSLFVKNVFANTATFLPMFAADEYSAMLRAQQPLQRRTTVEVAIDSIYVEALLHDMEGLLSTVVRRDSFQLPRPAQRGPSSPFIKVDDRAQGLHAEAVASDIETMVGDEGAENAPAGLGASSPHE